MNQSSKRNWWVWLVIAAVVVVAAIIYLRAGGSPAPSTDSATKALEQVGVSDEVSTIEQDLEATDLSGLDKELSDIEAELVK